MFEMIGFALAFGGMIVLIVKHVMHWDDDLEEYELSKPGQLFRPMLAALSGMIILVLVFYDVLPPNLFFSIR